MSAIAIAAGNRIRELREAQNQTVEQLAFAICISKSALSRYERGIRDFPVSVLLAAINELGVSSREFFASLDVPGSVDVRPRVAGQPTPMLRPHV